MEGAESEVLLVCCCGFFFFLRPFRVPQLFSVTNWNTGRRPGSRRRCVPGRGPGAGPRRRLGPFAVPAGPWRRTGRCADIFLSFLIGHHLKHKKKPSRLSISSLAPTDGKAAAFKMAIVSFEWVHFNAIDSGRYLRKSFLDHDRLCIDEIMN